MTFKQWWRWYWHLPMNYLGIRYDGVAQDAWDQCHRQWLGRLSQEELLKYLETLKP